MSQTARPVRPSHTGTVTGVEWLSPAMVRLTISSAAVRSGAFAPNDCTDAYLKLVLHDAEGAEVLRTYTVRSWRLADSAFDVDFMVHGDEGLAGPWARQARVGEVVRFRGPGGGYAPSAEAACHLFVGDLSALPAIEAALEVLPAGSRGHVVLVHDHAEDCREVLTDLEVCWVIDEDLQVAHERAVETVHALPEMPQLQAFVHGEAGFVRRLRRHLRVDRAVPAARLSISGYWKQGRTDEGWRADKKAWLEPVDEREAQVA